VLDRHGDIMVALVFFCLVCAQAHPQRAAEQTDTAVTPPQASEPHDTADPSWGQHESIKDCLSCHTDSLPDEPDLKAPVPQLCTTCHTAFSHLAGRVHGPVATGQCLICHAPHQASGHALLRQSPPQLCHQCHEPSNLAQIKNHQSPAFAQCQVCHEAHTGPGRMLLRPEFIKAQEILALLPHKAPTSTRFVGHRDSLQGVEGVTIVAVIDRAARFEPYGLTKDMLHSQVAQSLQNLGISVRTPQTRTERTASLSVHLSLAEIPSPQSGQITALSGSLNLKLEQTVELPPLPNGSASRTCAATTWDTGGIVVWGTRQCRDGLNEAIEVFVTQFSQAIKKANSGPVQE
jgi:predicted CXXCH cytochrome family protein